MIDHLPYLVVAGLSSLAAVLAWTAKLRWSKEYRDATDRIIQAKDTQIAALREWSPLQLRETAKASIEIYSERIGQLEAQIAAHESPPSAKEDLSKLRAMVEFLQQVVSRVATFDGNRWWDQLPSGGRQQFVEKLEQEASRTRYGAQGAQQQNLERRKRRDARPW